MILNTLSNIDNLCGFLQHKYLIKWLIVCKFCLHQIFYIDLLTLVLFTQPLFSFNMFMNLESFSIMGKVLELGLFFLQPKWRCSSVCLFSYINWWFFCSANFFKSRFQNLFYWFSKYFENYTFKLFLTYVKESNGLSKKWKFM